MPLLVASLVLLPLALTPGPQQGRPTAIVAMTFDAHLTTPAVAFPIMKKYGLVGTYFVDTLDIERGTLAPLTLRDMQAAGWSIQAYSGANMVRMLNEEGPDAVRRHFAKIKRILLQSGIAVSSIAAGQRSWNTTLAAISASKFKNVRVADVTEWQTIPVPDRHFVRAGGTASWSAADTGETLSSQLTDLISARALWIPVIHKVGDDADPNYSIPVSAFEAICASIAQEVAAGRVRALTFEQAVQN